MRKKKLNRRTGIWRKRFKKTLRKEILDFTSSVIEDERLVPYDIAATQAHALMLRRARLLTLREYKKLTMVLNSLARRHQKGRFSLDKRFEDVHMNVEAEIKKLSHTLGDKVHTARSRNDLVATDLRMYARDAVVWIMESLCRLQRGILKNARAYEEVVVRAFTHLQPAEPIRWSYYMCAQFFKFQRDIECLLEAQKRASVSVLGCCACAGTSHAITPRYAADLLGFSRVCDNCLDGVTDRDFVGELMYYCTQIALHIASLAEDLIIYSTQEFAIVDFQEDVVTGSSIMPQKKNPDACELLRSRAGKATGNLTTVLAMLKGLPSAYNRDLQEVKKIFFEEIDGTIVALNVARKVVDAIHMHTNQRINSMDWSCSTNLVDYLVRHGWAFRRAYNLVAQSVQESGGDINTFASLCARRTGCPLSDVDEQLRPDTAITNKCSAGSTGVRETRRQMQKAQKLLVKNQSIITSLKKIVIEK